MFKKDNSEGNLVPTDSEIGKLLAMLCLPFLQDIPPILNLLIEDDLSYDTLFWVKQE